MTNKERQRTLDRQKWFISKLYGGDQSGKMPYCHYCDDQTCTNNCYTPQKEREKYTLCAKAYNRQIRNNKTK